MLDNVDTLPLPETAITIHQLNGFFGDNHVLKNIDLQIPKGEITAIMGPSGCGKSTLLKAINGINGPDFSSNGSIEARLPGFEGINLLTLKTLNQAAEETQSLVERLLGTLDNHRIDPEEVRRRIGMVFQKPQMFPNLTLGNDVLSSTRKHSIIKSSEHADEILRKSLEQAGIYDEIKHRLGEKGGLSGGQEQRMNIARTLAHFPDIILMDEPTSKLDPLNAPAVEDTIKALKNAGKTIVIVTHSGEQAIRISDNIIFLRNGEVIEKGKTKNIAEQAEDPLTQFFLKGSTLPPFPNKQNFDTDQNWNLAIEEHLDDLDILNHIYHDQGISPSQFSEENTAAILATTQREKYMWRQKILEGKVKIKPDMIVTFITAEVVRQHRELFAKLKRAGEISDSNLDLAVA